DPGDVIGRKVSKSFFPERSGDVMIVEKYGYLFTGSLGAGTPHGTPHDYDTPVPPVVFGPGIHPGARHDLVTAQAAPVVLARELGIRAPRDAEAKVPVGLFR